jgi:hypothetical protein
MLQRGSARPEQRRRSTNIVTKKNRRKEEKMKRTECSIERITDIEEVRKLVTVRRPPWMDDKQYKEREEKILRMIADSGAILKGHFELGPDD